MIPFAFFDKLLFKIMRWMVSKVMWVYVSLGISHNQITLYGGLFFIPLIAYAFAMGTYQGNLLGLFFLFCQSFLDFSDGALGRKTNTLNKLGKWSDPAMDEIASGLVLAAIIIGVLKNYHTPFWITFAVLALFAHYGAISMSHDLENKVYEEEKGKIFFAKFNRGKTTVADFVIKEFIYLRSISFIFFGTLRYSVLIFALFDKLNYFLVFYAIFNNIRWFVMYWAYAQALNQPGTKIPQSNLKVIKLLREALLSEN